MTNINKLSFGLFQFKGKKLRDISVFFKRIIFTLKHGYSPVAQWETFSWFIAVMREILTNYRDNRCGTPVVIPGYNVDSLVSENSNIEVYNKILDEMIDLLDKMDETNPIYDDMSIKEKDAAMKTAKDKFFELFSKYFYTLWD